ncbi:GIY-YIG nuclease family protein [Hyphomonas oceanitis]|uniref:Bacteriophage T5 Orf172 DNA-binding domain-containing protein n=1 Tax=Hyphomonas oceanitis SCH89 TaxID=1280953 RepID=A0A059G1X7_9PROT|nr:GIY-YIG nuclease family protein [Hyphomonas oceanitis]KCZ98126.1 hypothetical protein HOC_20403 [Hyphomonas oceanitis SCH89]
MKLFISRFYGFRPEIVPAITFSLAAYRDKLLADSAPGDRIVFVATQTAETLEDERGRLLGMAEIGRRAVDTRSFVTVWPLPPEMMQGDRIRYPSAIPMTRAWKFVDKPLLTEVFERQLPRSATQGAIPVKDADHFETLALNIMEVELPHSAALAREREILNNQCDLLPSRGPKQSPGRREFDVVKRDFGNVYVLRFGKRDVWKVGSSHDPAGRAASFNTNIPAVVTGESWSLHMTQRTGSSDQAHELEHLLKEILSRFSIGGEMFNCSVRDLDRAWHEQVVRPLFG